MSCKMILTNPGCEEITKMELCLVQKVIYFDNKVSKTTVAKLDEQENSCETCDGEIQWELNITVPANLMPSFTRDKKAVDIFYLLEVCFSIYMYIVFFALVSVMKNSHSGCDYCSLS